MAWPNDDDWGDWDLEDDPELGFLAYAQKRGGNRGANDWWMNQFAPIFNQYKAAMAKQMQGGLSPGKFTGDEGFLGQFDWNQYRAGFSPEEKGMSTRRFAPLGAGY